MSVDTSGSFPPATEPGTALRAEAERYPAWRAMHGVGATSVGAEVAVTQATGVEPVSSMVPTGAQA